MLAETVAQTDGQTLPIFIYRYYSVLKCALQTPIIVTLLWSEIIGGYNTADTIVEIVKVGHEIS